MNYRKLLYFIFGLILLLPIAFLAYWPSDKPRFIACSVGEGDAILVTKGFTQILIDGGPNDRVLECLSRYLPFWDRSLELMINTHPEKDHLTGLISVLDRFEVKQLISNNMVLDDEVFKAFKEKVIAKKIPVYSPQRGDLIRVNEITLETVWPEKSLGSNVLGETTTKTEPNTKALVFVLSDNEDKNFKAFLASDISSEIEGTIIKDNSLKEIPILKVAHHGSKYSTSEEFLKALKPQIAVISVGKNQWGHPTEEVLNRLKNLNIRIERTDRGDVVVKE